MQKRENSPPSYFLEGRGPERVDTGQMHLPFLPQMLKNTSLLPSGEAAHAAKGQSQGDSTGRWTPS